MATQAKTEEKQERKKRVPLGAQRIKGDVSGKDPKYAYRWINDKPGRIKMALEGGYQFVDSKDTVIANSNYSDDFSSMKSQHGGHDASGRPYKRYLMAIRKELFEEDQAIKQSEVDEVDRAIRAGKFKRGAEPDKNYVPKDGIKIS